MYCLRVYQMSDQKKTPREIAAEMMGDHVGLKYYGLISNFHERDQDLIRKIEQAIAAEREAADWPLIELATLRADVTALTEYRDRMREENGRMRGALEKILVYTNESLRGQTQILIWTKEGLTQTPETERHLKIRDAYCAVVVATRALILSVPSFDQGIYETELSLARLDQLLKESEGE